MKPLETMTTASLQARYRREFLKVRKFAKGLAPGRVVFAWELARIRGVLERRGATVPAVKE